MNCGSVSDFQEVLKATTLPVQREQVDCMQCKTSECLSICKFLHLVPLVETTSSTVAVLAASQFLPFGMQEPGRGSIGQ